MVNPRHMDQHFMDTEVNLADMSEEDSPLEVELGGTEASEVRIEIGPLRLLLSYEQLERLDAAVHPYFTPAVDEGGDAT